MLEQLSRHSLIDLDVKTVGDLHIDQHHTVEDTGIAVGEAIAEALGDKRGIRRYGDALSPMDETLTRVALDISGRSEEHTSELQSLMRISYAGFCLKKKLYALASPHLTTYRRSD